MKLPAEGLRCRHGYLLCGWCHYHRIQEIMRRGRKWLDENTR